MVLLVGLALLLGLFLAVLLLLPPHNKSGHKEKAHSTLNNKYKASKSYTKVEVSLHYKRTDCWIIIKNKVYDVTSYVDEHPGGDAILARAGDDSTEGFFGAFMQTLYMAPKANTKRKKDAESCFRLGIVHI